jgi:hypothetical protein
MRRVLFFLFILAAPMTGSPDAAAQTTETRYSVVWRHVALEEGLADLVRLTGIDLVYDAAMIRGRVGQCVVQEAAAEELLRCLVQSAGLDFVRTSAGTYVLMVPVRSAAAPAGILGRVTDAATGSPLPFANILLAEARTGAAAGENGEFAVSGLLPGSHRVAVTYVGYETVVLDGIELRPGEVRTVEVALRPARVMAEPVIVDGLQQRLSGRLVEQYVRGGEMSEAAIAGDVMRSATAISGVATYRSLSDLHLQGGATGEHVTLLDGAAVRDPVSLGRYLGAFSPLAIGRLTVHKSGFGARHGSHLAGVVAVEHDLDTPGAAVQLDPVSLNGRLAGKMMLPDGWELTAMVSGRSSIWDQFRAPEVVEWLDDWNRIDPLLASLMLNAPNGSRQIEILEQRPNVGFSDLHAAARYRAGPLSTVTASLFRAGNRIDTDLLALQNGPYETRYRMEDAYAWTNWAGQARYQRLVGTRTFAAVRMAASTHTSGYEYAATYPTEAPGKTAAGSLPQSSENHAINEWTAAVEATHMPGPRNTVEAGLSLHRTAAEFATTGPFTAPLQYEAAAWHGAGHLTLTYTPGLQWTMEIGTRATYLPDRQTVYAEPRLSARYDGGGYALRAATGLYRQFLNQFELSSPGISAAIPSMLFWLPADATVAPPRAYHTTLDVLLTPTSRLTVQGDVYHKLLSRVITLDYGALAGLAENPGAIIHQSDFAEAGQGYALGGGARVQYDAGRLRATAGYGYSRSRRSFAHRFDGRMEPVPWEEPHRLSLDARALLFAGLSARATWQAVHGRSWAYRRAYYDYLLARDEDMAVDLSSLHSPEEQVLQPYQRLDLALTFRRAVGRLQIDGRVALLNALDRRNVFDWSLDPADMTPVSRVLPGRQPSFTLLIRGM